MKNELAGLENLFNLGIENEEGLKTVEYLCGLGNESESGLDELNSLFKMGIETDQGYETVKYLCGLGTENSTIINNSTNSNTESDDNTAFFRINEPNVGDINKKSSNVFNKFETNEIEELQKEFDKLFGSFLKDEKVTDDTIKVNTIGNIGGTNEFNQTENITSTGVANGGEINAKQGVGSTGNVFGTYNVDKVTENTSNQKINTTINQSQVKAGKEIVVQKQGFWSKLVSFFTGNAKKQPQANQNIMQNGGINGNTNPSQASNKGFWNIFK